jgi:hypothetical protein
LEVSGSSKPLLLKCGRILPQFLTFTDERINLGLRKILGKKSERFQALVAKPEQSEEQNQRQLDGDYELGGLRDLRDFVVRTGWLGRRFMH